MGCVVVGGVEERPPIEESESEKHTLLLKFFGGEGLLGYSKC